jgi:site-specific recombinase
MRRNASTGIVPRTYPPAGLQQSRAKLLGLPPQPQLEQHPQPPEPNPYPPAARGPGPGSAILSPPVRTSSYDLRPGWLLSLTFEVSGSRGPGGTQAPSRTEAALRGQTEAFGAATTLVSQTDCLIRLFSGIWLPRSERAFQSRLACWLGMLEQDADLRSRFQQGWKSTLASLDSVSFFAEAGIPAQHALLREITSRLFQRWLPAPREDTDTARLFAAVFASSRGVQRFLDLDAALFARLAANLWSAEGVAGYPHVHQDLHEALRLLAARVSARGTSRAVRQRSAAQMVEQSPSYALVFATERFIECEHSAAPGDCPGECMERWLNAVYACRGELAIVRINMEDAGVNSPLVFDLSAMDAALDRMEMLAATLVERASKLSAAVRLLLNTLVFGLLEDTRISSLIQQNFNLLARKTVERTGHGGEHYIAHSRREYWQMWGAAIGGGFLTVFTAALKLHLVAKQWPPFVEAVLVGTNYAISFLLLQIFGFALATKQPAMTGATLADIIRRNRGDSRRDQITQFGASISRTQLAAALGNILAVCIGAVIFDLVWRRTFHAPYLPAGQAQKVYLSLRPLASATAIDAALTGVLLWLAGLAGGWCENFAVYHRIPASIAQHPLGQTIGAGRMQKIADWVDRNMGSWSTSISLGYLLGFTPAIAGFFGLPLDVRHVTLNTGMFAFAAARFGPSAFRQVWLYSAMVGIAMMFVLNLGVSFAIASFVALRAYDVGHKERASILHFVLRQMVSSPLQFLFPVRARQAALQEPSEDIEQPAPAA